MILSDDDNHFLLQARIRTLFCFLLLIAGVLAVFLFNVGMGSADITVREIFDIISNRIIGGKELFDYLAYPSKSIGEYKQWRGDRYFGVFIADLLFQSNR